tara:strand:+ start:998 stop:1723 length:726 start_codon:yes stop_codon:yes gene_type:complete
MFLVCWHFCTSFLSFLTYAIGPALIAAAAFMMRRGLLRQRQRLRRAAMLTGLLGAAKIVLIDLRNLAETFICTAGVCGKVERISIDILAIILMGVTIAMWQKINQRFVHGSVAIRRANNLRRLMRWTRRSLISVSIFALWMAMPFLFILAGSDIPTVFLVFSWHFFASAGGVSLTLAFWELECYNWHYSSTRSRLKEKGDVWIPKDTLWTLVFVYALTMIMAFASSKMITDAASGISLEII